MGASELGGPGRVADAPKPLRRRRAAKATARRRSARSRPLPIGSGWALGCVYTDARPCKIGPLRGRSGKGGGDGPHTGAAE